MTENSFFSADELMRGLPGRRASTLLFAIESRTAHLVLQSQQATAYYLTEMALQEREQAFLQAVAQGRDFSQTITIQDLERYSNYWALLLPLLPDPSLNAAIAHLLRQKYKLLYSELPGLREVLRLDDSAVQDAYRRSYQQPLASIYTPQVSLGERLRWRGASLAGRLENIPPFWVALILTIPNGSGLLALPIAMSGVSIWLALALIIFFGLINMFTATALAETVARSGIMRYRLGFLGQLVDDFLGRSGMLLLSVVMFANSFLILVIFYLGVGGTLETSLKLPSGVWILLLFAVGVYFVTRKSFNSTVATTLVIGLVNLVLVALIILLTAPSFNVASLSGYQSKAFSWAALTPIFGVMLSNFFSHILVASFGRAVIQRDPSARSWIRGTRAAIGAAIVISCLWVLIIAGALSPQELASQTSTVLTPLAEKINPAINWLGSLLVILSLGMASILIGLALFFQTQEFLPGIFKGLGRKIPGGRVLDILGGLPLLGVFLLAEWMAYSGTGNFSRLLGFVGVISLPLMGGIFPVLLLLAGRKKGDYVPGLVIRLLGNRLVVAAIYFLYLALIFTYGIFIYESLLERVLTISVAVVTLIVTWLMVRGGAFLPRLIFELQDDQRPGEQPRFSVVAGGQEIQAPISLTFQNQSSQELQAGEPFADLRSLQSALLQIPKETADIREAKVWTHTLTPEGDSAGIGSSVQVGEVGEPLKLADGLAVLPLPEGAQKVRITL
jgi:amino acid permease